MFDHFVGLALKGLKERDNKKGDVYFSVLPQITWKLQISLAYKTTRLLKTIAERFQKRKNYRHFTSEFVLEVLYHPITAASKLILEIKDSHFTQGEIETLQCVSLKGGLSARMI